MPETVYLDRPPRIQPHLPIAEIEVPPPPDKTPQNKQSFLEMLLPFGTMAGYVLMALSGQGRNVALIIPMGIMMVLSTVIALRRSREGDEEIKRKKEAYDKRLIDLRFEMRNYHQQQRDFYFYNYPEPGIVISIAKQEERSRSGPRVWERRTTDPDFGLLRLGIGTRESTVQFTVKEGNNDEDPQMDDAKRLVADARYVMDVPVTLLLRSKEEIDPPEKTDVQHTLGIAVRSFNELAPTHGECFRDGYAYIRGLLVHFAGFHSPIDTQIYVIGTEAAREEWDWAEELPHSRTGQNENLLCFDGQQTRLADGTTTARMPEFFKKLRLTLQTRMQRLNDKDAGDVTLPFLLVVVDMLGMPPNSILNQIESDEAISMIIQAGHLLGAAVIFMTNDPAKIPGTVHGIIELETVANFEDEWKMAFRYAVTGVNTYRYVGWADKVETQREAIGFAQALRRYKVRVGAAASLRSAVDLLEMNNVADIDELVILDNWHKSRQPANQQWPGVKIGAKSGTEMRTLVFAAHADGVHGMIAGTTGSGKSELLLTLIVGLAVTYDPSIVNFVLVDFKGGAAFDEFRTLPHCVDIVTNLGANAVDRMFSAIKAELDRRGKMIADYRVKHIIEYRERGYHLEETQLPEELVMRGLKPHPFPNLFIIIDEFAEMVSENPEYKAQLDSITRLGRAIGVSLVLATQRPAGMVTDQMRANMKFKICLRVETPEDSRELLKRGDAAFLPPNIPGRAYIQIGNEPPELIQVARAGANYSPPAEEYHPPVIWLDRPQRRRAKTAEKKSEKTLSKEIVDRMTVYADDPRNNVATQAKPWPNLLPKYMPLDDALSEDILKYLQEEDLGLLRQNQHGRDLYLNRAVRDWLMGDGDWGLVDWERNAMNAIMGLVDHPRASQQRILNLEMRTGHVAVFGASGSGKTTFLRTLITSLVATHSPNDLHIYILDFGGRQLEVFSGLPHVGAVITPEEVERINRLMRLLRNTLERRKTQMDDLFSYNARAAANPDTVTQPAILVVIDNFAEVKENFEQLIPPLMSLLREGRNFGIHFATSADMSTSMSGKVYNLFDRKFALRLTDKTEYANIVGRSSAIPAEIAGRGLVSVDKTISQTPLEFQAASPVSSSEIVYRAELDPESDVETTGPRIIDEDETLTKLAQVMSERIELMINAMNEKIEERRHEWYGLLPDPIEKLAELVFMPQDIWANMPDRPPRGVEAPIGIDDTTLTPKTIALRDNPNFIITGPPLSGRTTMIRTWVMSLAHYYGPQEIAIVLIDAQDRLCDYRGQYRLNDLPHVIMNVTENAQLQDLIKKLKYEYETKRPSDAPRRPEFFIFVDNYDDVEDIVSQRKEEFVDLGRLVRSYRTYGLHFILCGSTQIMRANDDLRKQVWQSRFGFAFRTDEAVETLGGKRILKDAELPVGRGFFVRTGQLSLVQIATMEPPEEDSAIFLDEEIKTLQLQYGSARHQWFYDIDPNRKPEESASDSPAPATPQMLPVSSAPEMPTAPPPEMPAPIRNSQILRTLNKAAASAGKSDVYKFLFMGTVRLNDLSLSLLREVIVSADGVEIDHIARMSLETVKQAVESGQIKLVDTLSDDLKARITTRMKVVSLLNGENLRRLTHHLLEELPMDYNGYSPEKIRSMSPDDLQNALRNGEITLPDELSPELMDKVQGWLGIYRELSAANLILLPIDLLQELGIGFDGLSPQKIKEMPAEELQLRIDNGDIQLPETLEKPLLVKVRQTVFQMKKKSE